MVEDKKEKQISALEDIRMPINITQAFRDHKTHLSIEI